MLELVKRIISFPFKFLPLKKVIIFESNPTLSDNTEQIYIRIKSDTFFQDYKLYWLNNLEINSIRDDIPVINLKRSNFFQKIISEIKLLFILSRSSIYIYSHENYSRLIPKKGQIFFNLTHGISLKDTRGMYPHIDYMTYISVLSPFTEDLRVESFGGGRDKMVVLGFPRNDLLFERTENVDSYVPPGHKCIVWLPTYRRHRNGMVGFEGVSEASDLPILKSKSDFVTMNDILVENDCILIIKPHPAQNIAHFKTDKMSNIKVVTNEELRTDNLHLYQLLATSDALITDYSSVYIDYLLTKKPIGFTIDDIDSFSYNKGFMVENPKDLMPGPEINNVMTMGRFVRNVAIGNDKYINKRSEMEKLFHEHSDSYSSDRTIKFLVEKIKEK